MEPDDLEQLRAVLRRVIAVGNGKGGSYKTTLASNVAGLAADGGMRVLLIDLDPQGNVSEELGLTQAGRADDGGEALFDAIARGKPLSPSHSNVRDNLDVVAADQLNTKALSSWLASTLGNDRDAVFGLARALQPIASQYGLIVLDLPPGNEPLIKVAMTAARYLIIPTQADISSIKGMQEMGRRFAEARAGDNPDLELLGVAAVGIPDAAKTLRRETINAVHAAFGGQAPVFNTVIRHAIAPAVDARNRGLLVHELEAFVPTKSEVLARLRQRAAGADVERAVSSTATKLAGDFASITEEIFTAIQEREAAA
jgi:cellulose biosynthesis protein BcsQ